MRSIQLPASVAAALLLCAFILPAATVEASTVVRTGENISIAEDEIVQGDLYTAAGTFSHSGVVEGDELVLTGSYTNNGEVLGDVFVVGGSVQNHASVTDDVRIIGGDVTISEFVGGDVFVIGGVLTILSSANIAGDVTFFGGEVEINGTVGGSVMGLSDQIRIDGPVAGDVDVTSNEVTLGERADVAGDIRYVSGQDLIRSQSAVTEGEVMRNDLTSAPEASFTITDFLLRLFISTFAALVVYLFLKAPLQRLARYTVDHTAASVIVGLSVMITSPIIAVVLMVTVLGLLLGLTVFASVIALYVLAAVLTPVIVGAYASYFLTKKARVDVLWIITGALIFQAAVLIPFIGPLIVIAVMAIAIGAVLLQVYEQLRS